MKCLMIIKEILVSLAAITTVIVAIKGLRLWYSQLKGTTKYQLSQKLLEKTYKLQDELRSARSPWISVGEAGQREKEKKESGYETPEEKGVKDEAYVLLKRSKPIFEAVSELKIIKFQIKALWGEEWIEDIQSLIVKAFELRNAQFLYSEFKSRSNLKDGELELMDKYRFIVYESGENDEFWINVEEIILKIENRFRKYL